jgi:hypothetical protein
MRKPASYGPAEEPFPAGLILAGCCFCGADLIDIKIRPPQNNHCNDQAQGRSEGCKLLATVFKEKKRYYSAVGIEKRTEKCSESVSAVLKVNTALIHDIPELIEFMPCTVPAYG